MDVSAFVACRAPELDRFLNIISSAADGGPPSSSSYPIRRPASAAGAVRRATASPFAGCTELEGLAPIAARQCKPRGSIGEELKAIAKWKKTISSSGKLLPSASRSRRVPRSVLSATNNSNTKSRVTSATRRKRLLLHKKNRRRAKRATQRRVAVCKTGFRFSRCNDDDHEDHDGGRCAMTGVVRCRAYMPSHRYLAKRFAFGETKNGALTMSSHHVAALQYRSPGGKSHKKKKLCGFVNDNSDRPTRIRVRVPLRSVSTKTFQKIEQATRATTAPHLLGSSSSSSVTQEVVFDLSFGVSVIFAGNVEKPEFVPDLVERQLQNTAKRLSHIAEGEEENAAVAIADGKAVKIPTKLSAKHEKRSSSSGGDDDDHTDAHAAAADDTAALVSIGRNGVHVMTVQRRRRASAEQQQQQQQSSSSIDVFLVFGPLTSLLRPKQDKQHHQHHHHHRTMKVEMSCINHAQSCAGDDTPPTLSSSSSSQSAILPSCGNRSVFALLFRGGGGDHQKLNQAGELPSVAEASVRSAKQREEEEANRSCYNKKNRLHQQHRGRQEEYHEPDVELVTLNIARGSSSSLCGDQQLVLGLPPATTMTTTSIPCRSSQAAAVLPPSSRCYYSAQYRLFSKIFRDAVVLHGAVPGGWDNL